MKRIVGIASTPNRLEGLKHTIERLSDQVDSIHVHLNGYNSVPKVKEKNVTFHLSKKNIGAVGKFKVLEYVDKSEEFYFFTCDDDIIYPANYVAINIEQYEKGTIQSSHGKIFSKFPITDYKYGDISGYYFGAEIKSKKQIHIAGTGVCMMDSSVALQIPYDTFTTKNMVDVWVGCWAEINKVKQYILTHPAGWLVPNDKVTQKGSIWEKTVQDDSIQVQIINHYFKKEDI